MHQLFVVFYFQLSTYVHSTKHGPILYQIYYYFFCTRTKSHVAHGKLVKNNMQQLFDQMTKRYYKNSYFYMCCIFENYKTQTCSIVLEILQRFDPCPMGSVNTVDKSRQYVVTSIILIAQMTPQSRYNRDFLHQQHLINMVSYS